MAQTPMLTVGMPFAIKLKQIAHCWMAMEITSEKSLGEKGKRNKKKEEDETRNIV